MKRGRQSGTTLLELLIAVTFVSLISVGILMAMRVGLNAMTGSDRKLTANRRVATAQRIVVSQIAGMIPVVAPCAPDPAAPGPRYAFFEGLPDQMRFVSSYSLQDAARGYPRVLEYRVIPGEERAGEGSPGVRLIVNELVFTGPRALGPLCVGLAPSETEHPLARLMPVEARPSSFVLADRLAFCRILYRETRPEPERERWVPQWRRGGEFPTAVRIEMAPLAPDASRLQPGSLTVPVHVNKVILGEYKDEE